MKIEGEARADHHGTERRTGKSSAACRQLLPAGVRLLLAVVPALLAGGCAYKPTVPPSQGHIAAEQFPPRAPEEKILPPVTVGDFVPPPRPQVRQPTYSVVVHEVPVKELLFALSRDTRQNIDVHPGVQGLVTLNAIDETLPAILERLSQQVNMRYRNEGKTIVVMPDLPYFKTYRVNYVNVSRETVSSIGVSSEITEVGESGTGGTSTQGSGVGNASSTKVDGKSINNFWEVLRQNIEALLGASKAQMQSAEQRAARVEAERLAREQRIAQAEAVSRAGPNAASLFSAAFGPGTDTTTDTRNEIVINPVAGTVSVLGTEKQQMLIQQYLDSVTSASQRQVLIEATIAEVQLSNNYQAGVDWKRIAGTSGFSFDQQLIGSPPIGGPTGLTVGYINPNSDVGNLDITLRALEQFGNTRVLSSPKLMAINNQSAILKVVNNVVYFEIEAQTSQNQTNTISTFNTKPRTVPVGLVMSVMPQITEGGQVNLTVRPTISSIQSFVTDPNPALRQDGQGNPLPANERVENLVPQIQVREMESVLQVGSGQTIILGGLMQDNVRRDRDAVPGLGRLPSPASDVFSYRDEAVSKTELIVFLKPTVIGNPSLDSDELKAFRRFLPSIDPSGRAP